jgi:MFS family permease
MARQKEISIRTAQDVSDLVNSGRGRRNHSRAVIMIALGGVFIDAYDFSSLSFGVTQLKSEFDLSPGMEAVVTASIMVGAMLGAIFGGYYTDKLGRYKLFMADMIFFVVAALGCALAPNMELLIAFRLLMGLGIGLDFPVALSFIAEYSAARGRGRSVGLWQPMWYAAVGMSFAVLLPFYFALPADTHGQLWRWSVGFGAVPALLVFVMRRKHMEESPSWIAQKGDLQEAARILRRSYGLNVRVATDAPPVVRGDGDRLTPRTFARLFQGPYLRRTILAGTVCAMQSVQYFAAGFYLTALTSIIIGKTTLTMIIAPLLFNFVFGVSGGFIGARLTTRWGTRTLARRGFFCTAVSLALLGSLGEHPTGAVAILSGLLIGTFIFTHSAGPGSQGMVMAALSYPAAHWLDRGSGLLSADDRTLRRTRPAVPGDRPADRLAGHGGYPLGAGRHGRRW